MNNKQPASPCINVCRMGEDGFCLGCRRTIEEIKHWKLMPARQKRDLLHKLAKRPPAPPTIDTDTTIDPEPVK